MPLYLMQVAYTPGAWATQIKNPRNRIEDLRAMIKGSEVNILDAWYAFGEFDLVLLVESPTNIDIAATAIGTAAGGAVKTLQTTVLMSIDEGTEAMRRAGDVGYRPPEG